MIDKIKEQIELLSGYHEHESEDFNNGYNIALEELLSYIEEFEKSKKINLKYLNLDSLYYCNGCNKGFNNPYRLNIPDLLCDQCIKEIENKDNK